MAAHRPDSEDDVRGSTSSAQQPATADMVEGVSPSASRQDRALHGAGSGESETVSRRSTSWMDASGLWPPVSTTSSRSDAFSKALCSVRATVTTCS